MTLVFKASIQFKEHFFCGHQGGTHLLQSEIFSRAVLMSIKLTIFWLADGGFGLFDIKVANTILPTLSQP